MRKMFSKNQIKDIVNQGIESGEISGGTKLYSHFLTLSDDTNLIIITNINRNLKDSELATQLDDFYAAFDIFMSIKKPNASSQMLYDYDNSVLITFRESTVLTIDVTGVTITNDIVRPLQ